MRALIAAVLVLAVLAGLVQITFGGFQCRVAGGDGMRHVSVWELLAARHRGKRETSRRV